MPFDFVTLQDLETEGSQPALGRATLAVSHPTGTVPRCFLCKQKVVVAVVMSTAVNQGPPFVRVHVYARVNWGQGIVLSNILCRTYSIHGQLQHPALSGKLEVKATKDSAKPCTLHKQILCLDLTA